MKAFHSVASVLSLPADAKGLGGGSEINLRENKFQNKLLFRPIGAALAVAVNNAVDVLVLK